MADEYHIDLKDYDGNHIDDIHIGMVARSMTHSNFVKLFDNYLNYGGKDWREGKAVGEDLRYTHRTLQRSAVCFALGVLVGIADQNYTDARNETAIATAKKIREMFDNGELPVGLYI